MDTLPKVVAKVIAGAPDSGRKLLGKSKKVSWALSCHRFGNLPAMPAQQKPNCCFRRQRGYYGCVTDYPSHANSKNAVFVKYLIGCW